MSRHLLLYFCMGWSVCLHVAIFHVDRLLHLGESVCLENFGSCDEKLIYAWSEYILEYLQIEKFLQTDPLFVSLPETTIDQLI